MYEILFTEARNLPAQPEKQLLIAIVIRALMDLNCEQRVERASAKRWFLNANTNRWSWLWVKDVLDLEINPFEVAHKISKRSRLIVD